MFNNVQRTAGLQNIMLPDIYYKPFCFVNFTGDIKNFVQIKL